MDAFTCNWKDKSNCMHMLPDSKGLKAYQLVFSSSYLICTTVVLGPFWMILFSSGFDPTDFIIAIVW